MANAYTPLFEQIVDSSVWEESDLVVKVWITLLAKKRKNGIVYGSAFNIARWAKKSEGEVLEALKVLSEPDTKRLEPQPFDGRRIEKVDGGWLLLNAKTYQKMMTEENKRFSNAEAQARWRERKKCSTRNNGDKDEGNRPASKEVIGHELGKNKNPNEFDIDPEVLE